MIEEKLSPCGELHGVIVMKVDGAFEGRLYRKDENGGGHDHTATAWEGRFDVCALTETLAPARAILYEELGL
ncbi:MAG: hypothetical protein ACRD68_01855 [Pyrinomonadaceae bacterium]